MTLEGRYIHRWRFGASDLYYWDCDVTKVANEEDEGKPYIRVAQYALQGAIKLSIMIDVRLSNN